MDYPTILRVTSDFRQEWYEKLEKEVSVLTAKNCTSILCCANAIHIWKNPSGRNFCSGPQFLAAHGERNRRRSRIKTSPRCRRRIRRWTVISRKMPGEKTSDATPLGKTDPKEDEWKEHAKRIESDMENLCKRRGGRCGKACMDVKAEQPGAKKLQRIF